MGCFCSKESNGRVFDEMSDLSLPSLISQLHGNTSTVIQLSNESPSELKIMKDFAEDDSGRIMLHQLCELQLIHIQGNSNKFVFEREGIAQEVVPKEGDALFIMPFGTVPDVVLIEEGCHLSITKIRALFHNVTVRLTGRDLRRWRRRQHRPVSMVSTRWRPHQKHQ